MEVKAIARNLRISVRKARPLARRVQGQTLANALAIVDFSPLKAAKFLAKTLRSAAANAKNNYNLDPETLTVKKAVFDEGTRMKRYWCGARGSAKPIQKKLSHATVVLTNE
ncbi:MAG: 50S ribosomal protein L22 [Lentisphaeraceae bacterium]|nr:50S ribosomal protein L22 [Lentisphaeraceae bacterium]